MSFEGGFLEEGLGEQGEKQGGCGGHQVVIGQACGAVDWSEGEEVASIEVQQWKQ